MTPRREGNCCRVYDSERELSDLQIEK
jgi:hypothetical protein